MTKSFGPSKPKAIRKQLRPVLFLALLALVVMLPRLASPEFGLFDDGRSVSTAQQITHGVWDMSWDNQAGRFRPVYWLSFTALYAVFGARPLWFFLANLLLLIVTALEIVTIARQMGAGERPAWLSGGLFTLSTPVIENYYTLSKGEAVQLACLGASILLAIQFARQPQRGKQVLLLLGMALGVLLAHLSKETSLAIVPISAAWVLYAWFKGWRQGAQASRPGGVWARLAYWGAASAASLAFLLMRRLAVPVTLISGSYTHNYELSAERILGSAYSWSGWLLRDYAYLLPLALAALWAAGKVKNANKGRPGDRGGLWVETAIWCAGWLLAYLPWIYVVEYYLLPFAAGTAILSGLMLEQIWQGLRSASSGRRAGIRLCLAAAAFLAALTLANSANSARIQLAVDRANSQMLAYVAQAAPEGSTLIVNIQYENEYIYNIRAQLRSIYQRPDISVDYFKFQGINPGQDDNPEQIYVAAPNIERQPALTVRLGVVEATQASWDSTLAAFLTPDWQAVFSTSQQFRQLTFDLPRLLCPLLRTEKYCSLSAQLVESGQFVYGWTVYTTALKESTHE